MVFWDWVDTEGVIAVCIIKFKVIPRFWSMLGMKQECVESKYKVLGVTLGLKCSRDRNG